MREEEEGRGKEGKRGEGKGREGRTGGFCLERSLYLKERYSA